jgi:phosphate butyryltransferase
MAFRSFTDIITAAKDAGAVSLAISGANDTTVLAALELAFQEGLVSKAVLTGEINEIKEQLSQMNIDCSRVSLVDAHDTADKCRLAVQSIATGESSILMKGLVNTEVFMRNILDPMWDLRTDRFLSQVGIYEIPGVERLLLVSDVGVIITPDLKQKQSIVENCIDVALSLGIKLPRAALLSFSEFVNPMVPASVDAALLTKMRERGQIKGAIIDGPLALDSAVSMESTIQKSITSDVSGRADILIMPDLMSGNIFAKSLVYISQAKSAGVVVGSRVPIILTSRADPAESKFNSIAVSILLHKAMQPT